jgi:hypothetical protein
MRSPAATTVFTLVLALGGLAFAGSRPADGFPPGSARAGTTGAGLAADGSSRDAGGADGAEVSMFAGQTGLIGWRKGAAVSALASGGKSRAGEHGPHAGEEPGERVPAHAGRGGGPATPNEHAAAGQAHADEHAATGQEHADDPSSTGQEHANDEADPGPGPDRPTGPPA